MTKWKKLWTVGLACSMALGACMTSYANFQWQVDDGYLGTAIITLIDGDGVPFQREAVIIRDGATVTFTESDYLADYGETVYDYNGKMVGGALGLAVDAGCGVMPGSSFQYSIHSNQWVEKEYSNVDEVGVFEIGTQEYSADGAYMDTYWRQCFVIDGKYNPGLITFAQRVNQTAATDLNTNNTVDSNDSSSKDSDPTPYRWKNNAVGWWLEAPDGSYLVNAWHQSPESSLWYYMGADGYMLTNAFTPDGYYVNADGVWVQ